MGKTHTPPRAATTWSGNSKSRLPSTGGVRLLQLRPESEGCIVLCTRTRGLRTCRQTLKLKARLHEVSEALREHVLPCLTFLELLLLGRTCMDWYNIIASTPIQQLPARSLKGLLPPGLTSGKSFRQVFQQRRSLVAKLRGKAPFHANILQLAFPDSKILRVAWSPQKDLDSRSRWILVEHNPWDQLYHHHPRMAECSMHVVNLGTEAFAESSEAADLGKFSGLFGPQAGHQHILTALAYHRLSAAWTVDGKHIAVTSAATSDPGGDELFNQRPILTLALRKLDNTGAASFEQVVSLDGHGLSAVNTAGDAVLLAVWTSDAADEDDYKQSVACHSLPGLQQRFAAGSPPDLLMAPPLAGTRSRKAASEITWAANGTLFAVHWIESTMTDDNIGRRALISISHAFSIHRASDGACQHVREFQNDPDFWPEAGIHWDPSSSYLILLTQEGSVMCIRQPQQGETWVSTCKQRGAQDDPDCEASVAWQGSPNGQSLCVVDDYHPDDSKAEDECPFFSRATILDSSTGSISHQYCLSAVRVDDSFDAESLHAPGFLTAGLCSL
ncbi:hypothetical protein WJX74_006375 [Apatococcus lobatus]|uniref:Uncharacterized protein n=1 Tax=Apatococcus lobatus TaxID=904363 RepID=A0AAW1QDP9_9CHLO